MIILAESIEAYTSTTGETIPIPTALIDIPVSLTDIKKGTVLSGCRRISPYPNKLAIGTVTRNPRMDDPWLYLEILFEDGYNTVTMVRIRPYKLRKQQS